MNKSGQVLILVLLVVVVSLAVGLSVASRNLVNLQTSTQTQETQRVFSAAEGGVEDVLSRFAEVKSIVDGSGSYLPPTNNIGGVDVTVNVFPQQRLTLQNLKPGEIAQVDFKKPNGTYYVGTFDVMFGKNDGSPNASLELVFVCDSAYDKCIDSNRTKSLSGVPQRRYIYSAGIPSSNEIGTNSCPDPNGSDASQVGLKCEIQFSLSGNTAQEGQVLYLRIKPLWYETSIVVSGDFPSPQLPYQAYDIESSSKSTNGVSRRIKVTRTALPILPAVFDNALYSEGAITK